MEAQDAGFYARSDILFFLMRKEGIKEKKKKQRAMKHMILHEFYTGRAFEAYEYFGHIRQRRASSFGCTRRGAERIEVIGSSTTGMAAVTR